MDRQVGRVLRGLLLLPVLQRRHRPPEFQLLRRLAVTEAFHQRVPLLAALQLLLPVLRRAPLLVALPPDFPDTRSLERPHSCTAAAD